MDGHAATRGSWAVAVAIALGCAIEKNDGSSEMATPQTGDAASEIGGDDETCAELLEADPGDDHIVDAYGMCLYMCGINDSDDFGDEHLLSRASYDALEPGQPDMCFELRTAVYECFATLTCAQLWDLFPGTGDSGVPCEAELAAIGPVLGSCDI